MYPILFRWGPVAIYSFGFSLFLFVVLASFFIWREARRQGLMEEKVLDVFFLSVAVAIIFGRLGFVYGHWQFFASDWSKIIFVMKYPGFFYGVAVAAGLVAMNFFAFGSGLPILLVADAFSLALLPLSSLGYLGCLLDGCFSNQNIVLILTIGSLLFGIILNLFSKQISRSPQLLGLARRHGFFFLCYLIFILVSFLMLTVGADSRNQQVVFFVALVFVLAILVLRYRDLVIYVYGAISQKRLRAN